MAVALALRVPIYGTVPELWPLGFKSAGRRLFAEAGVPTACGCEDVHTVDEVCAAVSRIRSRHPSAAGVVLKHDNSGAGDGNAVIRLDDTAAVGLEEQTRRGFAALPLWYREDLLAGGVAEELVTGTELTSPSAQFDISPDGEVVVLATHEQLLGGDNAQVYMGCTFPARQEYARELSDHALAVGRQLARHGCCGRVSVDFVAGADDAGSWSLYALEMNLRKGGTTHPYAVLRNLVPGRYDVDAGQWVAADGTTRCYRASDNVVDPAWQGLPPGTVIKTLAQAGLQFDSSIGTGVVLHMLAGLAVDGRFGVTAIGLTPEHACELYAAVRQALPM